jgi:hypothetical protein
MVHLAEVRRLAPEVCTHTRAHRLSIHSRRSRWNRSRKAAHHADKRNQNSKVEKGKEARARRVRVGGRRHHNTVGAQDPPPPVPTCTLRHPVGLNWPNHAETEITFDCGALKVEGVLRPHKHLQWPRPQQHGAGALDPFPTRYKRGLRPMWSHPALSAFSPHRTTPRFGGRCTGRCGKSVCH